MKERSGWERDVLRALTEIAVGVTSYRLYSREHPRAATARERLCEQVEELAMAAGVGGGEGELTLVLIESELFVGDRPFTRTGEQVGGLVRHLRRHGLQHVTFRSGVRPEEIDVFLQFVAGPSGEAPPRAEHILVGGSVLESGFGHDGERAGVERPETAVRDRLRVIGDALDAVASGGQLPVASLDEVVRHIDRQLQRIEDPLSLMATLDDDREWLAVHSHNVALLSLTLAVPLGIGDAERIDLGLAALLHDVGKVGADPSEIARELALEETTMELNEDHPRRGLELLVSNPELPPLVPIVVFEHHLGVRGDGYPRMPEPRPPHVAARLVAVADAFDILYTVRGPRGACSREGVSAALRTAAGESLDPFFIQAMEVVWELSGEGLPAGDGQAPSG